MEDDVAERSEERWEDRDCFCCWRRVKAETGADGEASVASSVFDRDCGCKTDVREFGNACTSLACWEVGRMDLWKELNEIDSAECDS